MDGISIGSNEVSRKAARTSGSSTGEPNRHVFFGEAGAFAADARAIGEVYQRDGVIFRHQISFWR